jgi:hypothetical protein
MKSRRNATTRLENALHRHSAGRPQQAEAINKKCRTTRALHLCGVLLHQLNQNDEPVELVDFR